MKLVDVDTVKMRLRVDTDFEDSDLDLMIDSASAAVNRYLRRDDQYYIDNPDIEPEVVHAALVLIGIMYRDRDGEEMKDWQHGYLPFPVINLIYPLRDPAFA